MVAFRAWEWGVGREEDSSPIDSGNIYKAPIRCHILCKVLAIREYQDIVPVVMNFIASQKSRAFSTHTHTRTYTYLYTYK